MNQQPPMAYQQHPMQHPQHVQQQQQQQQQQLLQLHQQSHLQQQQLPVTSSPHPAYPFQHVSQGQPLPYYPNPAVYPQATAPQMIHQPFQQQPMAIVPHGSGGGAPMMPMNPQSYPTNVPQPTPYTPQTFSNPGVPQTLSQTPHPQSIPVDSGHSSPSIESQPQAMPAIPTSNPAFSTPTRTPHAHVQKPSSPSYQAQSTEAAARERARVTILLEINSGLLQELVNLQANNSKPGSPLSQPNPQQSTSTESPTTPQDAADQRNQSNGTDASKGAVPSPARLSTEYSECLRRLQANLAYLANVADRKKAGGGLPPVPVFMTPPPHLPSLNRLYTSLNELFPNASQNASPVTPQSQQRQQTQQNQQTPQQNISPQQLHQPEFTHGGPISEPVG
ncbi:hypothetical protein FQN57_006334 [Myotisia sp. PD_48]|nr:hypothetical protein FQN57_006334 [Myotisia sp. PD_48]